MAEFVKYLGEKKEKMSDADFDHRIDTLETKLRAAIEEYIMLEAEHFGYQRGMGETVAEFCSHCITQAEKQASGKYGK